MKQTVYPEVVRNAFYLPENELTEKQADQIMVHGLLMSKYGGDKKALIRAANKFCSSDKPSNTR